MKRAILLAAGTVFPVILAIYAQTSPSTDSPKAKAAAKAAPAQVASAAGDIEGQKAFLKQYCAGCHSQAMKAMGEKAPAAVGSAAQRLTLDDVDPSQLAKHAETWEKIVRKLRAGMMPPSGFPRPKPEELEARITWMESQLDKVTVAELPSPGVHRLNRAEYENVIRDLIGLDIDATRYLPPDDSTRGFDNVAAALTTSTALLEGYVSAAGKLSRVALGRVETATQVTYRVPEDTSQEYQLDGMPFGTRGGLVVRHEFPADGEYSIKVTPISKGNMGNTNPFGEIKGEKLEFIVDGERLKLFDWDTERTRADGTFNFKFNAKAGSHLVGVTFLAANLAPGNDLNKHFMRSTIETGGLPGYNFFPHVGKFVLDGPHNAKGAGDTESRRKILVCKPASAAQETACAKQIVTALARRAFRRNLTETDTESLMSFYSQGRNAGDFEGGVEMAVRRILADPEFVFRGEVEPDNIKPGQKYRLTDTELASRLSFFLWSSIPDDELLNLGTQNKLHEAATIERQVRRMLADPKAEQFVTNFAGQWLGLRALQTQVPATSFYPDFDDNLRQAMRKETEMFVDSVIREDRSIVDLLDGNYTFLNERLAKHYGIPNVYGNNFRRVELPPEFDVRRGLLGKGSLLTTSSATDRTAPVIRGKTVMQIFLGVEPPAPPPNVPDLPKQESGLHGAKPTMRAQMELHRKVEPCASCHKIMDPIGLSLENFDGIGQWRTLDQGKPIDASGTLVDGTKLNSVVDLRKAMVRYAPQFARVITEKMLIYGLGRGTEYFDMPLVRSIVHGAERNNLRFSSLVLGVVKSEPFQMNKKSAEQQAAAR